MHSQLIYDKGAMNIQWEKGSPFNNWHWENWIATCRKIKLDCCLTPYTKVSSKWITDTNVRHETLKLLEENRQKSPEYKHEQLFHEHISSCKGNKSKNEQMGLHQAKKLLYSQGQHQ